MILLFSENMTSGDPSSLLQMVCVPCYPNLRSFYFTGCHCSRKNVIWKNFVCVLVSISMPSSSSQAKMYVTDFYDNIRKRSKAIIYLDKLLVQLNSRSFQFPEEKFQALKKYTCGLFIEADVCAFSGAKVPLQQAVICYR